MKAVGGGGANCERAEEVVAVDGCCACDWWIIAVGGALPMELDAAGGIWEYAPRCMGGGGPNCVCEYGGLNQSERIVLAG